MLVPRTPIYGFTQPHIRKAWKDENFIIVAGDYGEWYTVVAAWMGMGMAIDLEGYCVEAQVLERFRLCISLARRRCRGNLIMAQWI